MHMPRRCAYPILGVLRILGWRQKQIWLVVTYSDATLAAAGAILVAQRTDDLVVRIGNGKGRCERRPRRHLGDSHGVKPHQKTTGNVVEGLRLLSRGCVNGGCAIGWSVASLRLSYLPCIAGNGNRRTETVKRGRSIDV